MNDTKLLTEIRDLLLIIAEPQIAARDKRLREELLAIAGKGKLQQAAILLMDGTRPQSEIRKTSKIDPAQLSRLIKLLKERKLLSESSENPKIDIPIPANFFESGGK